MRYWSQVEMLLNGCERSIRLVRDICNDSQSREQQHTQQVVPFLCCSLWAITSSSTYVCGCVRMSIMIVVPSRYTMSERPAVRAAQRQAMTPARVWSHQDLVWRRRLASSQSLHRQPLIALLARPGRRPAQLPSGDPCLIVIRPRVQQKPSQGWDCARHRLCSIHLRPGPFADLSAGRG